MKLGFSAIAQAGGEQDRHDAGAFGLAILAHFNDGRLALHLNYDFRAGVELANDMVFDHETRLEADLPPAPARPKAPAPAGRHRPEPHVRPPELAGGAGVTATPRSVILTTMVRSV